MSKTITDLREALFVALDAVKSGTMDLDKARAVNEIAKAIIDTAKVEVDYLRITGGGESAFIEPALTADSNLPPGITGIRQHRIAG
jgi:hypothetical protein